MKKYKLTFLFACVALFGSCQQPATTDSIYPGFKISSPAFKEGAAIPVKYSCKDFNVSPPLAWEGAPAHTQSFALVCSDPDAPSGEFVHWIIYNIYNDQFGLAEGILKEIQSSAGYFQGLNDAGKAGYTGPCPPEGTHHYIFRLYALNTFLKLDKKMNKEKLMEAMNGHVLGMTKMTGIFSK